MDPKFQMLWFGLALLSFIVATLWGSYSPAAKGRRASFAMPGLIPFELAFFTVVFFWTAWKQV